MNKKVAIFLDYDNIFINIKNYYSDEDTVKIVQKIKEKFSDDKILTIKAFADFQKINPVLTELQKNQVELRHVYSTSEGEKRKNASDIALTIDVIKNLYNKEDVDVYVLASCDSDMLPLINELIYHDKEVVVIYTDLGSKIDYKNYLKEWKVDCFKIEDLLGKKEYVAINEDEIKEKINEIVNVVNDGIRFVYNTYESGKGKATKPNINKSLAKAFKYSDNDRRIIIDKLLEWNILYEVIIGENSNYKNVLLNKEAIEEFNINLKMEMVTLADYK